METLTLFPGFEINISHMADGDMRNTSIRPDIYRPYPQLHSTDMVEYLWKNEDELKNIDGIYTQLHDVFIWALCADCPVLLFMGNNEIAAVHSGWRGSKAHICSVAVKFFKNTPISDLKVYIGPHIQKDSYEVKEDFFEHFPKKYIIEHDYKYYFDIERYLIDDLIAIGLKRENIYSHGWDTASESHYFSYRRDGMIGVGCVALKMIS